MAKPTKILILGGGFGGLYTARELEKRLGRDAEVEITLVNRENFISFTPMLHEVAASDLDMAHIVNPIRKMLRRTNLFLGDVQRIDMEAKEVVVAHGSDHHAHALSYDHVVIGLGATTNFFGLPGLEEHALTMKSLGDAIHLRNRLIANLEEADTECAVQGHLREALMTCVVAGGGFAGVETIAAVNDFVQEALRFYPNLTRDQMRMVLVHSGPVILPELSERLGRYAQEKLAQRGVDIRLNVRVAGVTDAGVQLSDGTTIETRTVVWTAGTAPNPLLGTLPCNTERGRIVTNEYLEVGGHPGVWAVGDCALIPDHKTGEPCPPTAQHALREGRVLARNIVAAIRGGKKKAFVFSTLGQLATIGRRTGVANILGINFSGFFAWWLWRSIYLSKLPRTEKKLRVALDWTLDLLFSKDLVQFQTFRSAKARPH
jgi:NADH dehydrogenase